MKDQILSLSMLCAISFLLFSCEKDVPAEDAPTSLPYVKAYDSSSPFNQKIDSNVAIDANSAAMVQTLMDDAVGQGFLISVKKWTMPVYFAGSETPRYDVRLTAGWAPKRKLLNVPIPDYAEPDPEDDGHLLIVDTVTGCEYDFWQAKRTNSGWKASWGNAMSYQNGDGIYDAGLSCRGSGFGLLGGLIWPQEIADGEIPHALVFSYSNPASGGPVSPATESDGTSDLAGAIPEGARVRLDPNLDLNTLGLNDYEMTIARCLQDYGMFCGDVGGGIQLYAVHAQSSSVNPYAGIMPDGDYVYLPEVLVQHFQVLEMGAQNASPDWEALENGCADFE